MPNVYIDTSKSACDRRENYRASGRLTRPTIDGRKASHSGSTPGVAVRVTEVPGVTVETGAVEPYGLLATKLFVPRSPPGFISRPRLVEWLDQGVERGLILVCGPPGFRKTALLADWIRR